MTAKALRLRRAYSVVDLNADLTRGAVSASTPSSRTFRTRFGDRAIEDAYVTFALNPDGSIETMKMRAILPLADFSFDYHDLLFKPEH